MNSRLLEILDRADQVVQETGPVRAEGRLSVGVDLGTAYTVMFVLDEEGTPLAGEYHFAQVVRDGVVVDFLGATDLVRSMKERLEARLGRELESAATSYPPGVSPGEVRAVKYVLESAGLSCSTLIDEPSAANTLLQVDQGVVVDVGGGTTGIAVIDQGEVVYTADEPTGGTHFSLVLAGARKISFDQAEALKTDPSRHRELFPLVRPVMEKIGSIISSHIAPFQVDRVYLVGGTCSFEGMAGVVQAATGVETLVPGNPLFVTPLGIALNDGVQTLALAERNN
ncbi:ethanolamine utilization protein EutJ [Alkalispirochaeta americana]|uniref:Ethanolamine utilization protein EutJ n=1 Tax=Alkalispirochaeta americana TaxID=159291 RepID=A0A1N6TZ46_9SPIO|nr:ethanolamine utilization protein EutJ [Alkalispirochaeta americana]SIQ58604.1 ethanolamine utilization protein EutJ [Alkalispirochaeta americana]